MLEKRFDSPRTTRCPEIAVNVVVLFCWSLTSSLLLKPRLSATLALGCPNNFRLGEADWYYLKKSEKLWFDISSFLSLFADSTFSVWNCLIIIELPPVSLIPTWSTCFVASYPAASTLPAYCTIWSCISSSFFLEILLVTSSPETGIPVFRSFILSAFHSARWNWSNCLYCCSFDESCCCQCWVSTRHF